MRSILRLLALRKDAALSNPYYLLEASEGSLKLAALPPRTLMGTWMLFMILCTAPFAIVLLSSISLVVQFYPPARILEWDVVSPSLILFAILSYGWSQRLALRFCKTRERNLHPKINDVKRGIFSSTLSVDTEEGGMSLVVQARKNTITHALELAGRSSDGGYVRQ